MIRGYQASPDFEAEPKSGFQWSASVGAGLIAGIVLLLVPQGSPWAALTFFSPVIMGRSLPPTISLPLVLLWTIHLLVAVVYALLISALVSRLRKERAILAGGVGGMGLYLLNLAIVSLVWPELRGHEVGVFFTHVVFGLIGAGAYRGLLRRKVTAASVNP